MESLKPEGRTEAVRSAQPCRNFCILGQVVVTDPLDGREKLVLSNFAAGETGSLIFVDPASGAGEQIPLPGDSGAWALLPLEDGRLLVGTCEEYGYLHSLRMADRTWEPPLRVEGESYIWNLVRGSDGMVYGGTYPGCLLVRYDPVYRTLESAGRMSEDPGNLYCRYVYGGVSGKIIVTGGMVKPFLRAWDMDTGRLTDFGEPGAAVIHADDRYVCTEKDGQRRYYDPATLSEMGMAPDKAGFEPPDEPCSIALNERITVPALRMGDGTVCGVRGQEVVFRRPEGAASVRPIPALAPATGIMTLACDGKGVLWGSCMFGQTIFHYDPSDGAYWNSPAVCDGGGEVYGMVHVRDRWLLSSYSGGDHVVYDPGMEWDQIGNMNPRMLRAIGPEWIRPLSRSVLGPDGGVWTGWSARYGVYGGALSRMDPESGEVRLWENPVPGQQVTHLTADGSLLYFTASSGGNGLPGKAEADRFAAADPGGKLLAVLSAPDPEVRYGAVLAAHDRVYAAYGSRIRIFDPTRLDFVEEYACGEPCTCLTDLGDGRIAAFCGSGLWLLDGALGTMEYYCDLPGPVRTAVRMPGRELWFASWSWLYRVDIGSGSGLIGSRIAGMKKEDGR